MISVKINDEVVSQNLWVFPCGEPAARLDDEFLDMLSSYEDSIVEILWYWESSEEFFQVAQIASLFEPYRKIISLVLTMPYIPFARQDRKTSVGDANALKVFAKMLNSLNFDQVKAIDPHSDVSEMIDRLTYASQAETVKMLSYKYSLAYDYILAPDAGALKKVFKVAEALGMSQDKVLMGFKTRDEKTGELSYQGVRKCNGTDIKYYMDKGTSILVVDDLCDGGGTFVLLAKFLQGWCGEEFKLDLYVSHGRFTKGVDILKPYYDNIFCACTSQNFKEDVKALLYIPTKEA